MSNTEIIPGMTEVMDYIKKQDEEIKKLKATCMGMCKQLEDDTKHEIEDPTKFYRGINAVEELKKENEELKTSIQTTTSYWTDKNELLQEEINKLKEEIEELKEEVEERTTYSVLPEEGKFMEENKKLKEEAEKIEKAVREVGDCDTINACLPIWYGEEKEETFKYQSDMEKQCHNDDIDKKQQVIDELKDENEELKEEIEKLHKTINTMACSSATTDFCMEHWIIHEQIDPKLLLGNWEEFYVKDENGKWIKKPKKNILSERKKEKKKKKKEFDFG